MSAPDRADRAFLTLRDDIVNLRRAPGAELSEAALAAELEISRTPVREALQRLANDGFVVLGTRRAATVAPITTDAVVVTYQIREALETYAYSMAARSPRRGEFLPLAERLQDVIDSGPRSVDEFSETVDEIVGTLGKITGNDVLADMIAMLRLQTRRMLLAGHDPLRQGIAEAGQYVALLRAVAEGRAEDAFALVMERLIQSLNNALGAARSGTPGLLGEDIRRPRI